MLMTLRLPQCSQHLAIRTDEEPEDYGHETNKDKAAQELGRKGSKKN